MGWFDNDSKDQQRPAPQSPHLASAASEARADATRPAAASAFGKRVAIKGTVVSDEDLTVFGKLQGTIRAQQALRVAETAEVKAAIHGRRVQIDGTVEGDISATETVILGPTASLTGNINTPSLQIREGAYFKGAVTMASSAKQQPSAPAASKTRAAAKKVVPAESSGRPLAESSNARSPELKTAEQS